MAIEQPDLVAGREYSKGELEEVSQINFGYQINGIVVRRLEKHSERRLILLFQRSDGPYPDLVTRDKIKYVGAGLCPASIGSSPSEDLWMVCISFINHVDQSSGSTSAMGLLIILEKSTLAAESF